MPKRGYVHTLKEIKAMTMIVNTVAKVIGKTNAIKELHQANTSLINTTGVGGALVWSESSQGHEFWKSINNGQKPDNYKQPINS